MTDTVTLVCTDGHRVKWPADLWPRPEECPARMDNDGWYCGCIFWPGKLVPDEEHVENTSDGYHTFRELYDHRIALFIKLMKSHWDISWAAHHHDDGSAMDGWLIAGMDLPTGQITYHLPVSAWKDLGGITTYDKAPPWDGHTPADVVDRLTRWQP